MALLLARRETAEEREARREANRAAWLAERARISEEKAEARKAEKARKLAEGLLLAAIRATTDLTDSEHGLIGPCPWCESPGWPLVATPEQWHCHACGDSGGIDEWQANCKARRVVPRIDQAQHAADAALVLTSDPL